MFRQLMQQITTLEQYRTLPQSHQETLVLQHMAAMYNITQPIQQPVQPTKQTSQQQATQPTQGNIIFTWNKRLRLFDDILFL